MKQRFVAQGKLSPIFLYFATRKQQNPLAVVRTLLYTTTNKGNANANGPEEQRERLTRLQIHLGGYLPGGKWLRYP